MREHKRGGRMTSNSKREKMRRFDLIQGWRVNECQRVRFQRRRMKVMVKVTTNNTKFK